MHSAPSYTRAISGVKPGVSIVQYTGDISVGDLCFTVSAESAPTVAPASIDCYTRYRGICTDIVSSTLLEVTVRGIIPEVAVEGATNRDTVYVSKDGLLTVTGDSTGIAIGTWDGTVGIGQLVLKQTINVNNRTVFDALDSAVRTNALATLAIRDTLLDTVNNNVNSHASQTAFDTTVVDEDTTLASLVQTAAITTTGNANAEARIDALEEAQVGFCGLQCSFNKDRGTVSITGNTTEVAVEQQVIITVDTYGYLQYTTIAGNGTFSVPDIIVANFGMLPGELAVVATVVDVYGNTITGTGLTTII